MVLETFCRTVRPNLSERSLSCLSVLFVYDVGVLWPNGWTDQEVSFGPSHIVLDGDPAPPSPKGAQQPPSFRPMSIMAKRSPISATAELVSVSVTSCSVHVIQPFSG